ncbi:histone-lysine N-methyltransferase SETMAR [Trichonephila clavipes]|nr:histone-lysine N-methyltransferase SETMAR [Trichonephila clavipes]
MVFNHCMIHRQALATKYMDEELHNILHKTLLVQLTTFNATVLTVVSFQSFAMRWAQLLNENPNELLSARSNVNASSDDDDGPHEIFFVPDDADKLQAIFEAVKTCLSLYASVDFENDGRTFSFPIISNQFDKRDSEEEEKPTVNRFRAGRESVGDDQKPGQANIVITSDLIDKVDDLTIVHDRLRFREVCAAWVPKQLTDQQKELHMGLALQHLFRNQENLAFMKRIVTGDETWCHHYEPETKRDSIRRHLPLKSSEP